MPRHSWEIQQLMNIGEMLVFECLEEWVSLLTEDEQKAKVAEYRLASCGDLCNCRNRHCWRSTVERLSVSIGRNSCLSEQSRQSSSDSSTPD